MTDYYSPVDYTRISSGYGPRSSPAGIGSTNHRGIDLAAPYGTPVVAPISGTVLRSGVNGGYGNFVEIKGTDGRIYEFAHLSSIGVNAGQNVVGGSVIGGVGSTGNSTGNHLHFGVKSAAGKYIDPKTILAGAKRKAETLMDRAKSTADGFVKGFAIGGPIGGAIGAVSGAVGGDKSWLEQFKDWLANSGFFQRAALVLIGLIFIGAALAWIGRSQLTSTITKTVKG